MVYNWSNIFLVPRPHDATVSSASSAAVHIPSHTCFFLSLSLQDEDDDDLSDIPPSSPRLGYTSVVGTVRSPGSGSPESPQSPLTSPWSRMGKFTPHTQTGISVTKGLVLPRRRTLHKAIHFSNIVISLCFCFVHRLLT